MDKTASLLIKGGHVVDPSQNIDKTCDVVIKDGFVANIGAGIPEDNMSEIIDATGCYVFPGFIDMHVHLREPGFEESETIETGCAAAAAGGFTTVCAMPNLNPPTDDGGRVKYILDRARKASARVKVIGSITRGRAGKELADMADMCEAGAVGFSDDGDGVANAQVMMNALRYSSMVNVPIIAHEEEASLSGVGQMNHSRLSDELGLPGIPRIAEEILTQRDIMLAEYSGSRLHITHISTAKTVEMIRQAKARGVRVTCDVTPHHLTLTEDNVATYNTYYKMKPPLRTQSDIDALYDGLRDNTIDAIATDHAPHYAEIKECEFVDAAFGVTGLETACAVLQKELIDNSVITWNRLVELLSYNPSKVLNIDGGTLAKGNIADITLYDPSQEWTVKTEHMKSKSKNTPYIDWTMPGKVKATIVGGTVYKNINKLNNP